MTKKDNAKNKEDKKDTGEIDKLKQELEEATNSYKRALADYQNLQKRVTDERRDLILSSNRDLLLRILSVLDTLELANKHESSDTLKVCISQFQDILKTEGVTRIETRGMDFDPHLMEAIAAETGEDGKVLEDLKAGYLLNDKVLRPAQVKVGKKD